MSDSIFSRLATPTGCNPRGPEGPGTAPATPRTPTKVASTIDAALLGILEVPLALGTTARDGFLRKEAELRAAFAALAVATQRGDARASLISSRHSAGRVC